MNLNNSIKYKFDNQLYWDLRDILYDQYYDELCSRLFRELENELCIQLDVKLHAEVYNSLSENEEPFDQLSK
jgi:hypothetical protein